MFNQEISEHLAVMSKLNIIESVIDRAVALLVQAIRNGNKILVCGNGGSAADAQHFVAEIVGAVQKRASCLASSFVEYRHINNYSYR